MGTLKTVPFFGFGEVCTCMQFSFDKRYRNKGLQTKRKLGDKE